MSENIMHGQPSLDTISSRQRCRNRRGRNAEPTGGSDRKNKPKASNRRDRKETQKKVESCASSCGRRLFLNSRAGDLKSAPSENTGGASRQRSRRARSQSEDSGGSNDTEQKCQHNRIHKRHQVKPHRKKTKKSSISPIPVLGEDDEIEKVDKYVALDCEMVGVGPGGCDSIVARVCVINWHGDVIFDTMVKATEEVTDYRTFVSGIEEEDLLSDDAMDKEECRSTVLALLRGKVLVGHALKNDLNAIGISHPWYDIRDTARYTPFMKGGFHDGILRPRRLRELAKEKLHRDIQVDGREHCPHEDASAALDLYKTVQKKWEKVMDYKKARTEEIEARNKAGATRRIEEIANFNAPQQ